MRIQLIWSVLLFLTVGLAIAAPIEITQADIDAGTIDVPIVLDGVQDLSGFDIDIYYDENLLVYDSVQLGDLVAVDWQQFFSMATDTGNSVVDLIAVRMSDTGVSGTGEALIVTFIPQGLGIASVEIIDIVLSNSQAQPITLPQENIIIGDQTIASTPETIPPPLARSGGGGGGGSGGGAAYQPETTESEEEEEEEAETGPAVQIVPTIKEKRAKQNIESGLGITGMAATENDDVVAQPISSLFVIITTVSLLTLISVLGYRMYVRAEQVTAYRENSRVIIDYIHNMWDAGWTNDQIINSFFEHDYPEEVILEMMNNAREDWNTGFTLR